MSYRGKRHRLARARLPRSARIPRVRPCCGAVALFLALVLTGCSGPMMPDGEAENPELGVQQEWNDLAGNVFWNACTGEYVGFDEGSIQHVVFSVKDNGDGGFHVRLHRNGKNYHGPGLMWTGFEFEPTGTQYRGNSAFNQTVNVRPPFPVAFTVASNVRVIQLGSGTNMMFHLVDHLTVNANGQVTADLIDEWFVCQ